MIDSHKEGPSKHEDKSYTTSASSPTRRNSPSNASVPNGYAVTDVRASSLDFSPLQKRQNGIIKNGDLKDFGSGTQGSVSGLITAVSHATFPSWANTILMISLIFGGCCSNVFALEAIIKDESSAGPLVTFAQFTLTSLVTLPSFISPSAGPRSFFLAPRAIPLRSWLVYTGFFMTVNLLNNWAFVYKISVPLHIIVRSGGPVASMIVGFFYNGKRYSKLQILAVSMLTLGVVGAALADAATKGQSIRPSSGSGANDSTLTTSVVGFTILALAMILAAFQGIYADWLYETYGRSHWKEALFYSHTLSLPCFLPGYSQLSSQLRVLSASPPLLFKLPPAAMESGSGSSPVSSSIGSHVSLLLRFLQGNAIFRSILAHTPVQLAYLLVNALTQYLCIRGVHLLSAKSSSLTVTIVLNIRKLVSLLLSIYLFGNNLASGILAGAVLVFVGGGLYGIEGARLKKKRD